MPSSPLNTRWFANIEVRISTTDLAGTVYDDVACDTVALTLGGGKSEYAPTIDPTTLVFEVRNVTGAYSPQRAGAHRVEPGWQVKVEGREPGGTWTTQFEGEIDDVVEPLPPGEPATAIISAFDHSAKLAGAYIDEVAAEVGSGDTFQVRADRVLDALGWPAAKRDLRPAGFVLQGTKWGVNAMAHLRLAAESTGNTVFMRKDGTIKSTIQTAPQGSPKAIFYADPQGIPQPPTAGINHICASDLTVDNPLSSLVNRVEFSAGALPHESHDATSMASYGERSYVREGLLTRDVTALQTLTGMYLSPDPLPKVTQVSWWAETPAEVKYLLEMDYFDFVQINVDTRSGVKYEFDALVMGYRIDMTMDAVSATVQTAQPFGVTSGSTVSGDSGATGATGPHTHDTTYLKLDASNDPLTGALSMGGNPITEITQIFVNSIFPQSSTSDIIFRDSAAGLVGRYDHANDVWRWEKDTFVTGKLTVNGVGSSIGSAGIADGATVLQLLTQRAWSFKQRGAGGTSALEFVAETGGKSLYIGGTLGDVAVFDTLNNEIRVGPTPRAGSQVRNVSHSTGSPPADWKPGDIHLRYA